MYWNEENSNKEKDNNAISDGTDRDKVQPEEKIVEPKSEIESIESNPESKLDTDSKPDVESKPKDKFS